METTSTWQLLAQAPALAIPAVLGLAALRSTRSAPFRGATVATTIALALSLLSTASLAVGRASSGAAGAALPVRVDAVTCAMLLLVSALGLVIVRYARTYLQGDPGQVRFARWLLATLAAVSALVAASNLIVVAAAWTATSLALHELLTFYRDRTGALVAAHKKFLVSRLADVCLWSALALLHRTVGSLDLDALDAWARAHPASSPEVQLAAALCAFAACLKCAQLPFHGWLTQVMEAPTPVSALLHAGVVNLGGFLMIRLAPLMAGAPAAQLLLVIVGMTTTLVAALVMTTRVSVKLSLAWSTCAQMGFMLVQCGLGAWHLALLHLIAHSLYKAHAFLGAGGAVDAFRVGALARRPPAPSVARFGLAGAAILAVAGGAVALRFALAPAGHGADPSVPVLALVVGLAFVPMLAQATDSMGTVVARAAGVSALYALWHAVAERLAPPPPSQGWNGLAWGVAAVGFVALFAVQSLLLLQPHGRLSRRLHSRLFAGLHLDDLFTRLTFRVWPPRLPPPPSARRPSVVASAEI